MAQKTMGGAAGDFLVHMESPQKCLTYGQITMPASGGDHTLLKSQIPGYPLLANNVLAIEGDEGSVAAFLLAGEAFADLANDATTTGPLYTILNVYDGVVLNEDMLQSADCQATPGALTAATIKAAVTTAKWVDEAENISTQST